MKSIFLPVCAILMALQGCARIDGARGSEISQDGATSLSYEEARRPLREGCTPLMVFLQKAELRGDSQTAMTALAEALKDEGYLMEELSGEVETRAGTHVFTATGQAAAYRFRREETDPCIDVFLFPERETAEAMYLQIRGTSIRYSGRKWPTFWVYHTWNDSENSDAGAVFYKERLFVNIRLTLPCPVPWEVAEADRYPDLTQAPQDFRDRNLRGYRLSTSQREAAKHHLKDGLDALLAAERLVISNLVPEEWLPLPGKRFSARNRVAAFMTMWYEVKYNFAFFDKVPDLDWDSVMYRYLPKVEAAETEEEFDRLLRKCMALLRDGHTSVMDRPRDEDFPNILIRPVGGHAIIAGLGENEMIVQSGLRLGDEITHVDGRTVSDVLEKDLYPYISASTSQALERKAYLALLKGRRATQVKIEVQSLNGETRSVALLRHSVKGQSPRKNLPRLEYRELPGDIAYVALNTFGSRQIVEEFDAIFDEKIRPAKGLILDVRQNNGGSSSTGYAIIGRLIDKPLKASRWKTRQYRPAFAAWGSEEEWYEEEPRMVERRGENPYVGPVVVLTGARTVSAAEDFLIPLSFSGRATLVGGKTAGSTGQPLVVDLNGLVRVRICTKRDTYPDGRDFVGVGVIPDVEVYPTREDVAASRDVVLEKALEILEEDAE